MTEPDTPPIPPDGAEKAPSSADDPVTAAGFRRLAREGDLWTRLHAETRPILLYGMGRGAEKILRETDARGMAVAGVFANDGFARGQTFRGYPVRARTEVLHDTPPGAAVVLLAFGSTRPDVCAAIAETGSHFPLYVPDFPVVDEKTLFDLSYARAHRAALTAARALFADAASRLLFDRIVLARLTGRLEDLDRAVRADDPARDILPRRAADLGAYTGDSARRWLAAYPLEFLLAVEPDPRSYRKLAAFAADLPPGLVECRAAALSDRTGHAPFDAAGGRGAGFSTGRANAVVNTDTLDRLLGGRTIDYIKYDVEGAEASALRGSAETIRASRPVLRVACYHRCEDLFLLPPLLHALAPEHALFLTRSAGYPLWDIDLVALPRPTVGISKPILQQKGEQT